jgi:hypothetical protein
MKKLLLVVFAVCLAAPAAYAVTYTFGWEDGVSTSLGVFGNAVNESNVSGAQVGKICDIDSIYCPGAYEGTYYYHVAESPHSGTPQVYLACITGLQAGDSVYAGFWGYDDTPDASPSWRIWGHYSTAHSCPECPGEYTGSASGNAAYTAGTGWDYVDYVFYYTPPNAGDGLVIEGRLYSSPSTATCLTDYFADLVVVDIPAHAKVMFPDGGGSSAVENGTWGGIKALYR